MPARPGPTFGVSIGGTINIGNYESQRVEFWVSDIPVSATPAERLAIMEQSVQGREEVFDFLLGAFIDKAVALKQARGVEIAISVDSRDDG